MPIIQDRFPAIWNFPLSGIPLSTKADGTISTLIITFPLIYKGRVSSKNFLMQAFKPDEKGLGESMVSYTFCTLGRGNGIRMVGPPIVASS